MQAAKVVRPGWGRGLPGVGLLAQQGEGPRHGQAGPGGTRFLGTEETMTTSCRSPKEGSRKSARAAPWQLSWSSVGGTSPTPFQVSP